MGILDLNLRCKNPKVAKEIILSEFPDAFCQKIENGWTKRKEYIIQRLIKTKDNIDGDAREDLGCCGDTEDQAWLFAADQLLRDKEKLSRMIQ